VNKNFATILADMRWPADTGIGAVQEALVSRKPAELEIVDLAVRGKIGHPLSPLAISLALRRARRPRVMFWSAGFVPPLLGGVPAIVMVHDLTHLKYYDTFRAIYYNLVMRPLFKRCAAIICVSEFTRREFLAWSGIDPSKVHVVHNGVDHRFNSECTPADLGFEYVLYAGNHRPYKNLARLIRAFAGSTLPAREIRLVLTGAANSELCALARSLGVGDRVCFLGRVPQPDLPGLYRGALAVAYVSLYEGFGLPLLEAMASGVPVIASNTSGMVEVAGDAALAVDPLSVAEISSALDQVTTDATLRDRLVSRGHERLKLFDWDRSAAKFWAIVSKCAKERYNVV